MSKRSYAQTRVEHLGDSILVDGLSMDVVNIQCAVAWSILVNIKALSGFLGLTRCYRRFVFEWMYKTFLDLELNPLDHCILPNVVLAH